MKLAVLVSAIALLGSVPACYRSNRSPFQDEQRCSIPSMQFLHDHGRPLVYLYSNSYMAPVQESLATGPYYLSGEDIFVFRALGVLLVALASGALFLHLASVYDRKMALAVAILVAVPNSVLVTNRLFSPGYPLGMLACVALLASLTSNTPRHYFLKGALAGFLHYIFPVMAPFLLLYFGVLCAFAADDAGFFGTRWKRSYLAGIALSLAALFPAVYFYLTRGSIATDPMRAASLVLGLGGLGLMVVLLVTSRIGVRRSGALALRIGTLVAGFVVVWSAHVYLFHKFDEPVLALRQVEMNAGSTYRLQSFPEWPRQALLSVDRMLPLAASPVVLGDLIVSYQTKVATSLPYLIIGLLVVFGMAAGSMNLLAFDWRNWRREIIRLLYPGAFLLSFVLLIPSWRLFSDYSVRYLIPTLPGLWILLIFGAERFLSRNALLALACLYAVVASGAWLFRGLLPGSIFSS